MKQYQSSLKSPSVREKSNTIVTQMESVDNFNSKESPINEQGFRSILRMLEQRQEFQEQEYKIKVVSLEKRIKYLIMISSQLTQQNTQLRLQQTDFMKEYEMIRDRVQGYEEHIANKNNEYKLIGDECDKLKSERERLVGLVNKYHERCKIRKKQVKDSENNMQMMQRAVNDLQKENLLLMTEKQNLLLQQQQQYHSEFANQQHDKLTQEIISKTSQIDVTDTHNVQATIKRFLIDYTTHLNYIHMETAKLFNSITNQYEIALDQNNSNNYNKVMQLFEQLIGKYNDILDSQIKLQYQLNLSIQPQLSTKPNSKRNSYTNLNANKSDIVKTSKLIKIQQLNMMLGQFIDSFILYIFRMRTLNQQIIKSESFSQDPFNVFRKVGFLIIATIRMQKRKKFDDFKLLVIEMPIEETMYQLLEIVSTQQQLIERIQE